MLLPTLRNAPVANSANAESISVSVISATRCERRFRTFFFLKKVNRRKRFRNPAHKSKFKLYRPLGYIIVPKILAHIQQANQIRIHSPAENHPCRTFLLNQDEFCRWKSSLASHSAESGCISPPEFIPTRHFLQIRMIFSAGIHPYKTFPSNQDAMTPSRSPRRSQPFRLPEGNPSSFSAGRYPPGGFPALQISAARKQACIPIPDNPSRPDLSA